MDPRVARLDTPERCERFAINVEARGKQELALEARRRAIQLRAAQHGATTVAETDALEAVYAYEEVLYRRHNRRQKAARTWQMIKDRGIISAVEKVVTRPKSTSGYFALAEMGMSDMAFEAVVLRHPECFTEEAVRRSRERLERDNA